MEIDLHERLDGIKNAVAKLATNVGKSASKQVRSPRIQKVVKQVATSYFKDDRPILHAKLDEPILAPLDELFQELLELSQRSSMRSRYKDVLKNAQKTLNVIEIAVVTRSQQPHTEVRSQFDGRDDQIVQTLADLVPTAAASYAQACSDLQDNDRTSYRGTAAELRESLREVLDHLAPDELVMKQDGFRLEQQQSRPTMKQKARFILKSRGASKTVYETPETAIETVEDRTGALARSVYNRSSLSAHVTTNRKEVTQIKAYVDVILGELLELS